MFTNLIDLNEFNGLTDFFMVEQQLFSIPWTFFLFTSLNALGFFLIYYKLRLAGTVRQSENLQDRHSPGLQFHGQSEGSLHPMGENSRMTRSSQSRLCIQAPVFNEGTHIEGLLEKLMALTWTCGLLEIQILDDSTDETTCKIRKYFAGRTELVFEKTIEMQGAESQRHDTWFFRGAKISHIHRKVRFGYKAGALNNGMQASQANFFCVFDCDFRPRASFLLELMPEFFSDGDPGSTHNLAKNIPEKNTLIDTGNPLISAVQAPWGFQNTNENFLTKIQSLLLNCHFHIEHRGRSLNGLLFNFNGTAGIWRRDAIEANGGWSSHSVTEDLYLSLKTWLKGNRIVYVDVAPCESELPHSFSSFLVQQRRWALGNGQVLRLLGTQLLRSKVLSLPQKIDAFWHMLGYSFSTLFALSLVLAPWGLIQFDQWMQLPEANQLFQILYSCGFFGIAFVFFRLFLNPKIYRCTEESIWKKLFYIGSLLSVFPVLSVFLVKSFWTGLFHKIGSERYLVFQRTPKNSSGNNQRNGKNPVCEKQYWTSTLKINDAITLGVLAVGSGACFLLAMKLTFFVGSILFALQVLSILNIFYCEFMSTKMVLPSNLRNTATPSRLLGRQSKLDKYLINEKMPS